jgi:hypothetical protein
MISYSSSSCTTKWKRDLVAGSLTRLIARYKGHDFLLLFFLYLQEEERLSSWQFTCLLARYKGHDLLILFLLYYQEEERLSNRQFGQPHGQIYSSSSTNNRNRSSVTGSLTSLMQSDQPQFGPASCSLTSLRSDQPHAV